jgi:hypothetical protein
MENPTETLPPTEPTPAEVVTLTLSVDETNLVLTALQELPHKVVHPLIQKVLEQANSQIK